MSLIITAFFTLVFLSNVVIGASGRSPFLGDVAEMLCLLAAALCFVVTILGREAAALQTHKNQNS